MKNIAVINTCDDGSTGKIGEGLFSHLLEKGYNAFFCYGMESIKKSHSNPNYYLIDKKVEVLFHVVWCRLTGYQGTRSVFATRRLIRFLSDNKIDTIYCISLHGYYLNEKMLFDYIKKKDINLVYVMVDEYAYLGKCGYSNGCDHYQHGCTQCPQVKEYPQSLFFDRAAKIFQNKKYEYAGLNHAVFVGPEYTIVSSKKSELMHGLRTEILDEAVDVMRYCPRNTDHLKKKLGISDDKIIIVCVAPFSYERKGCIYFVELARMLENNHNYVFVHVGFDGNKAILPTNYIPIGYVSDQDELGEFYSLGDLFVFPSLLDTMPNACLEALSAGTPLLCFNVSGMPYIADNRTATFVEAKNVKELAKVVLSTPKKTEEIINSCREYALNRYDNRKYFCKLELFGQEL